jgi:hypothetical protein
MPPARLAGPWLGQVREIRLPDGGTLRAEVRDGSNCFNLNGLARPQIDGTTVADPAAVQQLSQLLMVLGVDGNRAANIASAAADWVDSDLTPLPAGTEQAAPAAAGRPPTRPSPTSPSLARCRASRPTSSASSRPSCARCPEAVRRRSTPTPSLPEQAPLLAMLAPEQLSACRRARADRRPPACRLCQQRRLLAGVGHPRHQPAAGRRRADPPQVALVRASRRSRNGGQSSPAPASSICGKQVPGSFDGATEAGNERYACSFFCPPSRPADATACWWRVSGDAVVAEGHRWRVAPRDAAADRAGAGCRGPLDWPEPQGETERQRLAIARAGASAGHGRRRHPPRGRRDGRGPARRRGRRQRADGRVARLARRARRRPARHPPRRPGRAVERHWVAAALGPSG